MNSKQRRKEDRIESKYKRKYENELLEILIQFRDELVGSKINKEDFIKTVNQIIEDKKC